MTNLSAREVMLVNLYRAKGQQDIDGQPISAMLSFSIFGKNTLEANAEAADHLGTALKNVGLQMLTCPNVDCASEIIIEQQICPTCGTHLIGGAPAAPTVAPVIESKPAVEVAAVEKVAVKKEKKAKKEKVEPVEAKPVETKAVVKAVEKTDAVVETLPVGKASQVFPDTAAVKKMNVAQMKELNLSLELGVNVKVYKDVASFMAAINEAVAAKKKASEAVSPTKSEQVSTKSEKPAKADKSGKTGAEKSTKGSGGAKGSDLGTKPEVLEVAALEETDDDDFGFEEEEVAEEVEASETEFDFNLDEVDNVSTEDDDVVAPTDDDESWDD